MSTSTINTIIGSAITTITDVVSTNLPLILVVAVGVFAVVFGFRLLKRLLGR